MMVIEGCAMLVIFAVLTATEKYEVDYLIFYFVAIKRATMIVCKGVPLIFILGKHVENYGAARCSIETNSSASQLDKARDMDAVRGDGLL